MSKPDKMNTYDYSDNPLNREFIEDAFYERYKSLGYSELDEVKPYPSVDDSVLFIGAQISTWKSILEDVSSKRLGPVANPQNCIRLQNLDSFFNTSPIKFLSYFRTHGALSISDDFPELVESAYSFLSEDLNVEEDRICIETSSELLKTFDPPCEVKIDSHSPNYYEWEYGDVTLKGKGITFAIKNTKNGVPYDIGNVINILKNEDPYVAEWGFGVETLLTSIYEEIHPIKFADIPVELKSINEQVDIKYVDALVTTMRLIELGVKPSTRGAGSQLCSYISAVGYLRKISNRTMEDLSLDINQIAEHIDIDSDLKDNISFRILRTAGNVNYIENVCSLYSRQRKPTQKELSAMFIGTEIGNIVLDMFSNNVKMREM